MMRTELRKLGSEKRYKFTAKVGAFGTRPAYKGPAIKTVLLVSIMHEDKHVANHLWMTYGASFEGLNLEIGDNIEFEARVSEYIKGYFGRRDDVYKPIELDYRLIYPSKIKKFSTK